MLQAQFEVARITSDKSKFTAHVTNFGDQYLDQIEDIVLDPPATGRYEKLKSELIKRLADSDGTRVQLLFEGQEMEDRTPYQFYRDLKKLAVPSISRRLRSDALEDPSSVNMQQVLTKQVQKS